MGRLLPAPCLPPPRSQQQQPKADIRRRKQTNKQTRCCCQTRFFSLVMGFESEQDAHTLGVFFSQPFSVRSSNFSSVSLLWRDKKSTGEPCSLLLLLNALVQEVQAQLEGCFSALGRDSSRAASATEEPSLPKTFDRSLSDAVNKRPATLLCAIVTTPGGFYCSSN